MATREEILGAIDEILGGGEGMDGDDAGGDFMDGDDAGGDAVAGDEILGALFSRRKKKQARRRAVVNSMLAQNGVAVRQAGYTRGYNQPLGFFVASIAASGVATPTATPQVLFTPTRLIYTPVGTVASGLLFFTSISTGRDEVLVDKGGAGVPCDAYLGTMTGDNLRCRTVQPGTQITLTVVNRDGANAHGFSATMQGKVAE